MRPPRKATVSKKNLEVDIVVGLVIDGGGRGRVETGVKFLDHMLETFAKHSLFDLDIRGKGEFGHDIVENIALTLGEAIHSALGEKRGIKRFGSAHVTMDDSLARVVVDLSGRPYAHLDLKLSSTSIEDMKAEDYVHFVKSLAQACRSNIHIAVLYGENDHHKIEACTKGLALAFKEASSIDERIAGDIPSVKGEL